MDSPSSRHPTGRAPMRGIPVAVPAVPESTRHSAGLSPQCYGEPVSPLQRQLVDAVLRALDEDEWTQVVLAGRAGVTAKHLNALLMGRAQGTLEMWERLADALDRDWDVLLR